MNFDTYTLTLFTIVLVFWTLVILKARSMGRPWFPNLIIVPAFLITLGLMINHFRPTLGTYLIGGLHALLMLLLAFKLSTEKK